MNVIRLTLLLAVAWATACGMKVVYQHDFYPHHLEVIDDREEG